MSQRYFSGRHLNLNADKKPLARIRVLMYVPQPNRGVSYEVLDEAKSEEELLQIMLHLPDECRSVEIHLFLRGRIVGNATYSLYRDMDEHSGKWDYLNADEYGACVGLWRLFGNRFAYVDYYEN